MKTRELTIVQMNDSHGYSEIHPELFWASDHEKHRLMGGHARSASVLNELRRQRSGRVLAFDCGDTIHDTRVAVDTKGMALVPLLNALEFDAMTAHWEFAYGPGHFRELVTGLPYPPCSRSTAMTGKRGLWSFHRAWSRKQVACG